MKVLITSKSFGKYSYNAVQLLKDHGIQVIRSDVPNPTAADIIRQIKDCEGLIVGNDTVNREVIESAPKLKIIHMHGTGVDAIDVDTATSRGIWVANVPGLNSNAVAELTLCFMLALGRKLLKHVEVVKEGKWEREAGKEITGSIVGILGFGNVGRRIVELLRGFQATIIGYDPWVDLEWAKRENISLCLDMEEVFKRADWLILSLPLNASTEKIVNHRTLSIMKSSAYIVNTARGGLIDEEALFQALESKQIAGAALDAFAKEPLPMDSILKETDALLTPHIAASTIESIERVSMMVAKNVVDALIHGVCESAVNNSRLAKESSFESSKKNNTQEYKND
ncbi:MAG: phosphoglycerate dehydrogenase [Spirochaetes bacterium]|nr:phosphoglycerate dehydrogenase [Spirochaetota bacterium]